MVESSTWSDDVDIKEKRVSMKLPGIGIYTSFQQQVRRLVTMSLGLSWARRWKNFFCPQLFSRLSPLPLVSSIFTVLLTIWFVIHLTFWSVLPGSQVGSSIFNLPVPDIFALILPSAYVSSPQYCGYVDFFHCPLLFIHDLPSIKFFHFFYDIKSLKGENSWFLLGSLQEVPFVGVPIQEVMVEIFFFLLSLILTLSPFLFNTRYTDINSSLKLTEKEFTHAKTLYLLPS